ncbi:YdcF family protein [Frankia sp. R82]|uniref:YdcF family protein n=1 Tax=Frankia sp. R82 TaxID=2950553 RepID=UPI002043762D|nr:YdcF family protein [Frankia sp. R82]MCM3882262.1 YdcF family protein [Frankia sp. R82]
MAAVVAVAVVPIGLAEGLHWQASRRLYGDGTHVAPPAQPISTQHPTGTAPSADTAPSPGTGRSDRRGSSCRSDGAQVVLVLGFPATRHGRLHPLQRWRTEIGVRSLAPGEDSRLIFSGGGPPGAPTEAETMAAHARDVLGMPARQILTETAATSTWENVGLTVPWLESARTIAIASDPLHAARGRRYLHRQRPDLAARLVPADDYRLLEHWRLKVPTAVYAVTRPPMRRLRVRLIQAQQRKKQRAQAPSPS